MAVETYFEAPERVAAMILVAPAIIAPLMSQNFAKDKKGDTDNQKQEEHSDSNDNLNPFIRLFSVFSKLIAHIANAIVHILRRVGDVMNSLYKKALCAFLRSAIGVMLVIFFLHNRFQYLKDIYCRHLCT